jgi:hypothetical protein
METGRRNILLNVELNKFTFGFMFGSPARMRHERITSVTTSSSDDTILSEFQMEYCYSFCKILGFHGGDCEECRFLGCYVVWFL